MSIDLRKRAEARLVDLTKKAAVSIRKTGLTGQKARVALVLDYSGSMVDLYKNGTVQKTCERLLGLAVNFDDDRTVEVFIFNDKGYEIGPLREENFFNFVKEEIMANYRRGGTRYAGVMQMVMDKYFPGNGKTSLFPWKKAANTVADQPVFVLFITDGDNGDRGQTEKVLIEAAKLGIFWQFVGIGDESFRFLQKLDDLTDRFLDNADFFQLNDLDKIGDDELYDRLLTEFPGWIKQAKRKGLLREPSAPTPAPAATQQMVKGQKADLTKKAPGVHQVVVEMGWDTGGYRGPVEFDADMAAFLLQGSGKVASDEDMIFYGQPRSRQDAVVHDGQQSKVTLDFRQMPADVEKIAFTLTIYEGESRGQNFGQMKNAYIRVVNGATGAELLRFDLGTDFTQETAIVVAELYRHQSDWKFNAVANGFFGGLAALCAHFGVDVAG